MRSLKSFLIASVAIMLTVAGSGSTFIAAHRLPAQTDINLPDLTGPYKVGRVAYEWVDQSRDETYASVPGLKRDLMVDIWFPATPGKRAKIAPYMENSAVWDLVTKHPELDGTLHAFAYTTTTVATDKAAYPVLIFEPDTSITSFNYTSIIEDLASHGYIVVGMSHPYNTAAVGFPDGRVTTVTPNGSARPTGMDDDRVQAVLEQDIHFVLDQIEQLNANDQNFKGHIDLTKIGIFGHYYGGLVSVLSAVAEPRIKAGAAMEMDPKMQMPSAGKPFMYMGVGAAPQAAQQTKDTYWMYSNQISTGNFGDFPWLKSFESLSTAEVNQGDIDPAQGIKIINSYLTAFFDHYLNGADLKWPTYDEMKLVSFPAAS